MNYLSCIIIFIIKVWYLINLDYFLWLFLRSWRNKWIHFNMSSFYMISCFVITLIQGIHFTIIHVIIFIWNINTSFLFIYLLLRNTNCKEFLIIIIPGHLNFVRWLIWFIHWCRKLRYNFIIFFKWLFIWFFAFNLYF